MKVGGFYDRLFGDVDKQLPAYNDDLLLNFRERKIKEIPTYLDELFRGLMKRFNGELIYHSYRVATPKEVIHHYVEDKIINKRMQVQPNTLKLVIFEFEFNKQIEQLKAFVPYMDNHKIMLEGTNYYPMFPMIERVIHRIKGGIRIKVAMAPLTFWIYKERIIVSEEQNTYRENPITVRIHQFKKSNRKMDDTPLVLYHFLMMGLEPALAMYGFRKDDLIILNSPEPEEGYEHFQITKEICFKVHKDILTNRYKLRTFLALYQIVEYEPKVKIEDLLHPEATYFKFCLGKYVASTNTAKSQFIIGANKHLATNETILDPPAIRNLRSIGLEVDNLYDLLFAVFNNIDSWMNYQQNNLFNKKIGTMDALMQGLVSKIHNETFAIVNNPREGLSKKSVGRLMRSAGNVKWKDSGIFHLEPSIYNDNWLLSIGATRTKSLEITEAGKAGGKIKKRGSSPPMDLIKAHYSQAACETQLTIPNAKPCETGSINPHMEVDEVGNILEPYWTESIKTAFD